MKRDNEYLEKKLKQWHDFYSEYCRMIDTITYCDKSGYRVPCKILDRLTPLADRAYCMEVENETLK